MTNTAMLDRQKGKVDRSALLGRLMWYSIPDTTLLDYSEVVGELATLGIARALPSYPEDSNVFRRATSSAQRKHVPVVGHPDRFENWMIRDLRTTSEDMITRRIVVEVVDPTGKKLDYQQIADVSFDKKLKAIKFMWINGWTALTHPTAQQIMAEISVNFQRWKGKLHDQAIREWIRRQIIKMGGTPVKPSGGVYFLEERFADTVEALETFVDKMLPPGADCHSVEIPDTDKQREMVKRAIENETVGEIERMMLEVQEIRKAGKLTTKAYLEMVAKVRNLTNKMNGYSRLLQKDMSAITNRLELLDSSAKALAPFQSTKRERTGGNSNSSQ